MATKIVVDTNILIRAFLDVESIISEVFLTADFFDIHFYVPDYVSQELFKYQERICSKSWYTLQDVKDHAKNVFCNISVISRTFYQDSYDTVFSHMEAIDPKDTDFVALAYKLKCPLWTNDKTLQQEVDFVSIMSISDFFDQIWIYN